MILGPDFTPHLHQLLSELLNQFEQVLIYFTINLLDYFFVQYMYSIFNQ